MGSFVHRQPYEFGCSSKLWLRDLDSATDPLFVGTYSSQEVGLMT